VSRAADLDATAAQAPVAGRHYTTAAEIATLRDSGVPILVGIAERDELMSPASQRELAVLLRARTYTSSVGMGARPQS
jgi:hypothetical protein